MKNWVENLGVPRMAGTTILGIAGIMLTLVDYSMGQMDRQTAISALVAAITAIVLPQHKATPEDGDQVQNVNPTNTKTGS